MTRRITLRHLDNREFARTHDLRFWDQASWIIGVCAEEFECDEDAVTFDENEDGELISVYGQPVAQSYVSYGRF